MVVEDSSQIILQWTGDRQVPQWVEATASDHCTQCKEQMQRFNSHNCRLCGLRFCSLCSAKYHVPPRFRRKAKNGPVRCCYSCVSSCLHLRTSLVQPDRPRRPGLRISIYNIEGRRVIHIHPPVWQPHRRASLCLTCEKSCGKGHVCRVCGSVYCSGCSIKMNVPSAFRKKGKMNPVRVCCNCRFDLFGGAVCALSSIPIESRTLKPLSFSGYMSDERPVESELYESEGLSRSFSSCTSRIDTVMTPIAEATETEELSSTSSQTDQFDQLRLCSYSNGTDRLRTTPLTSGAQSYHTTSEIIMEKKIRIAVQWENWSSPFVVVKVGENTPLDELRDIINHKCRYLIDTSCEFLCRGKVIAPEFYDIFQAIHVRPVLFIRASTPACPIICETMVSQSTPTTPSPCVTPPSSVIRSASSPTPTTTTTTSTATSTSTTYSSSVTTSPTLTSSYSPTLNTNAEYNIEHLTMQKSAYDSSTPMDPPLCMISDVPLSLDHDTHDIDQPCVRARFSFESTGPNFLSFERNDEIAILIRKPKSKWWYGKLHGRLGWVPSNYVMEI